MAWVVAGGAAAVWVVLLLLLTARTEPRDVDAGPPTLDLVGDEPPAVVALIAGDWELSRDAVTATVLDLAARRHVAIEWIAPATFLRVRDHSAVAGADADALTDYEQQVLAHLRSLSDETSDGMVPAAALTTGPEATATQWWRRFEKAVTADARARGLSRARWAAGARAALMAWAVVVGVTVGIAATSLPRDNTDDDPVGTAIALGVAAVVVLGLVTGRLRGERDTVAGRVAAARWLGVRTMLADDPTFAVQPPAAVAVWGRLMSYGAAMGVTATAAETLPLGTESERHAWSPVGDRWRPVSIRYPDVLPPGYGRHPLLVAFVGLLAAGLGFVVGPGAIAVARSLLEGAADFAGEDTVPWGVRLVAGLVVGVVVTAATVVAIGGLSMLVTGIADLVRPRRQVEGRVLRVRERGDDDDRYWHVAVDDGTTDRVRAWRVGTRPAVAQGDTVRAAVSRWLAHVQGLTVVPRATPRSRTRGRRGARAVSPGPSSPRSSFLPAAVAVAAALGQPVHVVADAVAHPLTVDGASVTFAADDGGRVVAAWIPPATLDALRALPRSMAPAVPGVGDEAYRAPMGGGVVARVGERAVMVSAALPGRDDADRDAAVAAVAALTTTSARTVVVGQVPTRSRGTSATSSSASNRATRSTTSVAASVPSGSTDLATQSANFATTSSHVHGHSGLPGAWSTRSVSTVPSVSSTSTTRAPSPGPGVSSPGSATPVTTRATGTTASRSRATPASVKSSMEARPRTRPTATAQELLKCGATGPTGSARSGAKAWIRASPSVKRLGYRTRTAAMRAGSYRWLRATASAASRSMTAPRCTG